MKNSEDIIKGLEVCSKPGRSCCSDECPYYKQDVSCTSMELKQDALALIKKCYPAPAIQLTIPYGELQDLGCGDCVCRVCARNECTDNWAPDVPETELCRGCGICYGPIELPDYCPRDAFLPEEGE